MEKLFGTILALILFVGISAQSITDQENFIRLEKSTGDTISIRKSQVNDIRSIGNYVYIADRYYTNFDDVVGAHKLLYSDYGYSSAWVMRKDIEQICFSTPLKVYSTNANENVDTIWNYVNGTLRYKNIFIWDGTAIDSTKTDF